MKRKLNLTAAALATTATVALFAGSAFAQGGPDTMGAPMVCPTTQMFPGHNNCVMPTASSPGGGSFPGSFLVPGTNTSFAVHGFIQVDVERDFGPHYGDTTFAWAGTPVEGNGVTASAAHSLNGGTTMGVKATRPNIETHTPTAYGLLKTYIEFDFNQTGGTQLAGNNDVLRLRQAYGALGPWLIGQTLSLNADPQAYADTAAGAQDVGMMDTFNVRRPQIRYTWLGGNGLSVAGSVEEPSYFADYVAVAQANGTAISDTAVGAGAGELTLNGSGSVGGGYYNWPHFVVAPEWDQPWGHIKFAVAGGIGEVREAAAVGPSHQYGEWMLNLTGHLNTWGKDALRGGVWYSHGAADFNSDQWNGGAAYNTSAGGGNTVLKAWAAYANYEHFFTGQWRGNVSMGYFRQSNPGIFASAVTNAGIEKVHFTSEVNMIYSPVPQTDFILEWQHYYRETQSSANGTANQLDAQFKFYF